jgi:hypothetical protein
VFYHLSQSSNPFCSGYFGDGILQTVFPDWPQISILLISASQVDGINGVSHQHLILHLFFIFLWGVFLRQVLKAIMIKSGADGLRL